MAWVVKDTRTGEYRMQPFGFNELLQYAPYEEVWTRDQTKAYRFETLTEARATRVGYIPEIKVIRLKPKTKQIDVNEALAMLLADGRITVSINEDGERVFRLTEPRD